MVVQPLFHLLVVRSGLREERHQVVVVVQHRHFVHLESSVYVEQFDVLGATSQHAAVFAVQPDVAKVADVVSHFENDDVAAPVQVKIVTIFGLK
ncbi:hypothetical protein PAECIP111893_01603 [Paenibacillus plantiphilus]|uniref:Secreted protein n=1 Tax=Paenibacillus plantiphilus TaxID=2905650 RepID=A0ABN8GA79_9BACL|nr:hypothetical protein PAECIP111893_01603 [Paenibacillus plantiphilus]